MIKRRSNKGQNVFVSFLNLLNVKHTESFSNKYLREHPYKYNLFGISKMLSDYGIKNKAFKTDKKEEAIHALEVPFIAHTGSDFVVVLKITDDRIYYLWYGKNINIPIDEFLQSWSGVVLLAETDENSIEPNYKENRKKELVINLQKYGLFLAIALLTGGLFIYNRIYENLGWTLVFLINLIGIYASYLLEQKQLHIHSEYADKICSLFKQSDCNNVLESKAAKLWGIIGWSEIGLGYFISNTLLLTFLPFTIHLLAIVNIFTLPYSFWSVWYQKFKAKQWCPLCLSVQVLLWAIFIINLLNDNISFSGFVNNFQLSTFNFQLLFAGIVYFIPTITINLLIPFISQAQKTEQITQEFNSLKTNEDVFEVFLKKQTLYEVDKSTSKILLGNPDSEMLVTILTNPHCAPCAWMHARVEKLLRDTNNAICVQYIFSSFNEELKSSARFLIAIYFAYPLEKAIEIYGEWFRDGKNKREEFFQRYDYKQDEQVEEEFLRHEKWRETTQLRATPTVLVNGYQMPGNYKIEDLKYFTDLKLTSNKSLTLQS